MHRFRQNRYSFAYISLSLGYSSRKSDTDSSLLGPAALPQTHAVHYFVMYAEHDTIQLRGLC